MIKANELRIGNLVYKRDLPSSEHSALLVNNIYRNGVNINEEGWVYSLPDLDPIPLTAEMLEKAGFKEQRQTFFTWYIFGATERQFRLDYSDETTYHWVQGNTIVALSYVHQLQNLYFALTGEELAIALPVEK